MKILWIFASFWIFARATVGGEFQSMDLSGWIISLVILGALVFAESFRGYLAMKRREE